ncbi:hypothetical protein D3C84_1005040 [compost metagenome]
MGVELVDLECVAVVVEESAQCVGQNQASLGFSSGRGGFVSPLVQALDSFQEGKKG